MSKPPVSFIHGHSPRSKSSPTYHSWNNMVQRCYNKKTIYWERYGGRGVTICDKWRHSFASFLEDMGERPKGKTLDRINNDGNYEPTNCRWSTPSEQNLNMSLRKDNKVGETGVCFSKRDKKYRVTFMGTHIGYFHDRDDAIIARKLVRESWA